LFSSGLASLGIRQEDRIALILADIPEWTLADLSIMYLYVIAIPNYETFSPK
jgi:long-subunit acyl-CoA synthetase (AMP-forming)